VLRNGLPLGIDPRQGVFVGAVIILAVSIDYFRNRCAANDRFYTGYRCGLSGLTGMRDVPTNYSVPRYTSFQKRYNMNDKFFASRGQSLR
jgi:hypothetical protein